MRRMLAKITERHQSIRMAQHGVAHRLDVKPVVQIILMRECHEFCVARGQRKVPVCRDIGTSRIDEKRNLEIRGNFLNKPRRGRSRYDDAT